MENGRVKSGQYFCLVLSSMFLLVCVFLFLYGDRKLGLSEGYSLDVEKILLRYVALRFLI